nr:MAG TPA: zinc-ribbon domain protein [Caudoviricetes sp.]
MVTCPVCGQKMGEVRYLNGVIMLRVQCRRCRSYIKVDVTGVK